MVNAVKQVSVLVVDDDDDWLEFAKASLESTFSVHTALDGNEGLTTAVDLKPGLIILDVMMPGSLDGFSVFCQLRGKPETRDIPVIMFSQVNLITGLGFDLDSMEQYLHDRPAGFIEKPVTHTRLLNEVQTALGKHS